jgi:hypothetical protein
MKTHKRIKLTGKVDTQMKKEKKSNLITTECHQTTKINNKRHIRENTKHLENN